ncbi:LysM peptidoglycan-binding domain-containing protein [Saprospira sp. CCB-QB6]|uniref:LysM peptidoglycan-binding domain-containing protein n=1 Tax=Saprospira sp. CCB-QB6 TaxID=3023936 RepID=UPI00234B3F39|nr:LysM peptidoglycan-binding domain-containing protein [Saprospira sp. CCB-QB6]WCL80373.1 LysM peptidoglycan-binding domain-containing protein [Saprospira sp. CCB-QB6]
MIARHTFSQEDIAGRLANIRRYEPVLDYYGQQLKVEAALLKAIVAVESSGNARAGAGRYSGAKGLMQITRQTWMATIQQFPDLRYRNTKLSEYLDRDKNDVWADASLNTLIGTLALILKARSLSRMTGLAISANDPKDAPMLLTAYNAGEYTVMKAFERAKAGGSKDPQMDFLDQPHLQGAIKDVVERFNLSWDTAAKFKEISQYAAKVFSFLDVFRGNTSSTNNTGTNNNSAPQEEDPKPTPTPTPQPTVKYYTVVSGDTGYGIARKLGISFSKLSAANPGVNWARLSLGQKLQVGEGQPQPEQPVRPEPPKTPKIYTVQRGDSLGILSRKFNVSIAQIKALNKDQLQRWGTVEGFFVGAKIKLPQ